MDSLPAEMQQNYFQHHQRKLSFMFLLGMLLTTIDSNNFVSLCCWGLINYQAAVDFYENDAWDSKSNNEFLSEKLNTLLKCRCHVQPKSAFYSRQLNSRRQKQTSQTSEIQPENSRQRHPKHFLIVLFSKCQLTTNAIEAPLFHELILCIMIW